MSLWRGRGAVIRAADGARKEVSLLQRLTSLPTAQRPDSIIGDVQRAWKHYFHPPDTVFRQRLTERIGADHFQPVPTSDPMRKMAMLYGPAFALLCVATYIYLTNYHEPMRQLRPDHAYTVTSKVVCTPPGMASTSILAWYHSLLA